MRDHYRPGDWSQLHQVAQHLRVLHTGVVHRHIHQVLQRGHAVLRRLHRHLVGHAVLRIQPEVRRGLETAAQRDQHALRHVARIHSHLRGLGAVNLKMQGRQTEHLLHVHIGSSVHVTQTVGDLLGDDVVALHVLTGDLDVNRCGQSKVENLGHDIGRLKEELHAGELAGQVFPQSPDVALSGVMMLGIEADQDLRIAGADDARVAE